MVLIGYPFSAGCQYSQRPQKQRFCSGFKVFSCMRLPMKTSPRKHGARTHMPVDSDGSPRRRPRFSVRLLLTGIFFFGSAPSQSAFGATPADAPRASAAGIKGVNVELNG